MFEPRSLSQGIGILVLGLIAHFIFVHINNKKGASKNK